MPEAKTEAQFTLQSLPYAENALEPVISKETLALHHGKHHATYVNKLNALVKGTPYAGKSLEAVIVQSAKDSQAKSIFNNAAQVWNHDFYWHSMRPGGGGQPPDRLKAALAKDFGSEKDAIEKFKKAAVDLFGSGWVWLVATQAGKIEILTAGNADTPIIHGVTPLLGIDVWEHAYYVDYQNRRPDYVEGWTEKLINWDFAEQNLRAAKAA